jgi:hypothetical protein
MSNSKNSYSKVLSANDIGRTGSHQSGILIPKEKSILSLFPYLDPTEANPSREVTAIATVNEVATAFQLRFVYYNGKLFGRNSRNEYRLTRTAQLFRLLAPNPGDRLVLSKDSELGLCLSLSRNLEEYEHDVPVSNSRKLQSSGLPKGWTMHVVNKGEKND